MGGRFVWYDLMTKDVEGAWAFYTEVVGWGREKFEGMDYEMLVGPKGPIGGIEKLSAEAEAMGAPSHWLAYVDVDDVDATAALAIELGGKVHVGPVDIPNIGRFCVIQDPTGAVIAAFHSENSAQATAPEVAPGIFVWHECFAGDLAGAWDFYTALFGWVETTSMDMGESGQYRMYAPVGEENSLGGMMTKPSMVPSAHWLYYVNVDDVTAAAARVKEHGGQVMNGPMQIPGDEWVAQCFDPQGGGFAIHSKTNSAAGTTSL